MRIFVFYFLVLCSQHLLWGQQEKAPASSPYQPAKSIDVDFLFNYYEQEGIHSAVTGGAGTEELNDRSGVIILTIPVDSLSTLMVDAGFNHYTSASTDKIDSRISSASRADSRGRMHLEYSKKHPTKKQEYSFKAGGSIESDYISTSVGGNWSRSSSDGDKSISLGLEAFFDTWVVYFPEELRGSGLDVIPTDKRRSFNFSATYTWTINKRMQAGLSGDISLQQGLLSTPFHRVYFQNIDTARVENLPTVRIKVPLGLRFNYFVNDFLIFRTFGRLYGDSFGIFAQTFSLEAPIKISNFLSLYPLFRYHNQSAARYFAPYQEHILGQETYFTSDFDLSAFQSQTYGGGFSLEPVSGIGRFRTNRGLGKFKNLDARYAWYTRSDGLTSWWIGVDFGFEF